MSRNYKKRIAKHMTAQEIKAVKAVKMAVNKQPLHKRIMYVLRIIGGRW